MLPAIRLNERLLIVGQLCHPYNCYLSKELWENNTNSSIAKDDMRKVATDIIVLAVQVIPGLETAGHASCLIK